MAEARRLLNLIKDRPSDMPPSDSPAHSAFDPRIMRRLSSLMPLKALTPLLQEDTWKAVDGLLDGWEVLSNLSTYENLLAWDVSITPFQENSPFRIKLQTTGNVQATIAPKARKRSPYIRSLAQVSDKGNCPFNETLKVTSSQYSRVERPSLTDCP